MHWLTKVCRKRCVRVIFLTLAAISTVTLFVHLDRGTDLTTVPALCGSIALLADRVNRAVRPADEDQHQHDEERERIEDHERIEELWRHERAA